MIKIIKGTYGYRNPSNGLVEAKNTKSKPFSLSPEREDELVALGVAEYVGEDVDDSKDDSDAAPADAPTSDPGQQSDQDPAADGNETPKYSTKNTVAELTAIANQYGIEIPADAKKKEIVEILDAKLAAGADTEDDGEDDGDAAPNLSALMPE